MKPYELPEALASTAAYLHPLELKQKWNLTFDALSEATGCNIETLQRYEFPDYSSQKRRPYRNKTILRLAKVLDELWSMSGCPYASSSR